ncbi:PD-(D/E)XK motif protein [Actinoplanes sp. URMC 104]|uniref:PD-(D/E)XK motif protein n=1 Tax=Actinoplanes sp. URMC 104 TaxID=3423409 RepID=UPI003F1A84F0
MTEQSDDARHLSMANVDIIWTSGHPMVLPIAGTPLCKLDLHPVHGTITLLTAFTPPEPDVAKWRNISFSPVNSDDENVGELTVSVEGNVHGAYGLLTSVADQLQLHQQPLAAAVATAIAKHRDLFAGKAGLSAEQEVGLFGELIVLDFLIEKIGAGPAVEAWQGPLSEEHDFVFSDVHLEVKTTSGEHRRHMMHGFTQLVPLRNVPLSVISIQLTRSNHQGGATLGQMVSSVRAKSGGHRPKVDAALEAMGWEDADVGLYNTYWMKRNHPRAFGVDDRFPALTAARLAEVIPNFKAISDLSYRLDLTDFTPSALPEPLADFVTLEEDH